MAKKIEAKGGLAWLFEEMIEAPIGEGEFTVQMALEEARLTGADISASGMRNRLLLLVEKRKLASRRATVNGKRVSVYRRLVN